MKPKHAVPFALAAAVGALFIHPEIGSSVDFGARDPGVLPTDAGKFFARLATPDKQMVSLPGADHAAQIEDTHDAWIAAVVGFLNRSR